VLNPGRTGGALEVYRELSESGVKRPVIEAQTLLFACRKTSSLSVHINGIKEKVAVGVMPSRETSSAVERLHGIIPQFFPVKDVRSTSFGNIGAMFHPALAFLNASRIEAQIPYEFYKDGATPRVGELIETIDRERIAIGRKAGAKVLSIQEWLQQSYSIESGPLYRMMSTNPAYQGIMAPASLDVRYFEEDVPTGLVPLEVFAKLFEVHTPAISSLIHLISALMGVDYRKTGRTATEMGIEGMHPSAFIEYIEQGIQ
jgi:opine dehydrogenase